MRNILRYILGFSLLLSLIEGFMMHKELWKPTLGALQNPKQCYPTLQQTQLFLQVKQEEDVLLVDKDTEEGANSKSENILRNDEGKNEQIEVTSSTTSDDDERSGSLRRLLQSIGEIGGNSKDDDTTAVGSTVVAGLSIPELGIHEWQSYELRSIYDQGADPKTGMVVRLPRQNLNEKKEEVPYGYTRYVTLYSERYHEESGPVIVSPEEIGLTSLREEVLDSLLMASPVFGLWTALALTFANQYNERYGGNFFDLSFEHNEFL